ncbi:shikimate kinase [Lysinibacillus sp. FSL R7-0073]|uniref:Shikimate kinase n=1 Tax=Lysinibacillus fusiformis TaxID=28031 RepID=A0A1E4R999_9BACI|nr:MULTISPECIES: shikimate kinase [Lysinibacillus]MBD8521984.1 shikimate kinase [Lysinibacillus fusiformis]MCR8853184.1 shikimate kinase [Lysinibacillus fusiformis]MED4885748.1 shikimate kinase [Lysinibacillus fusiformis]ODV56999.1 shikimate kinase [Lysinibacillus fusiformis]
MRKIYLVGFMGSGKSALGRRLSFLLKMPYYDMDHEIVRQQGMSIPQIFEKYGEAHFRKIETEFLKSFRDEACIISTGGGVAINAENRKIMRRSGLVFFLDASFEDIYKRVQHDPNRPIVQSSTKEELESLYHYRRKFYRDAGHIQVLTEGRTIRQILEYLVFQVKRLKNER